MSTNSCVDALVRDLHDALPTTEGALERCDLCHALAPVERLRYLPCADFVLLLIETEDDGVTTCSCHAPSDLLADGVVLAEVPFEDAWAACPACQTDVDAGRWHLIADRAVTNQVGVLGDFMSPEFMEGAHLNLLQLIQDHHLPGDWS